MCINCLKCLPLVICDVGLCLELSKVSNLVGRVSNGHLRHILQYAYTYIYIYIYIYI